MDIEYWRKAWHEGRIGFHQQSINPRLVEYFQRLELARGSRVLVALCGKSRDLLWLRDQGCGVIGVEVSDMAVNAFFEENGLEHHVEEDGSFRRHSTDGIEIIEGDFFELQATDIGPVAAAYDRAALIALPEPLRRRYGTAMKSLLPGGARVLLLSIEFDIEGYEGPPFSVSADEVSRIYAPEFSIELLIEEDILDRSQRFRDRGASWLIERVFMLQR